LLGSHILGWRTVCAVDLAPYARSILLARQRDGMLDRFPIWDDVCTFDGRPWRGSVDVVSGGFPCQDISAAGRGLGLAGARSGLWREMLRVVDEVRPRFVFAENSPRLRTLGLGTVLEGLAGLGYDSRWCVLGARHVGAPHWRDRMWILAYANGTHLRDKQGRGGGACRQGSPELGDASPWPRCPDLARVDDGLADRVDRTRATGNGQVPRVAALAWTVLTGPL